MEGASASNIASVAPKRTNITTTNQDDGNIAPNIDSTNDNHYSVGANSNMNTNANTTTITTTLSNNKEKMKHAGHVYVRGLFRRVWRPRYLELDPHGVLRYYEANNCNNNNNNNGSEDSLFSREMQAYFAIPTETTKKMIQKGIHKIIPTKINPTLTNRISSTPTNSSDASAPAEESRTTPSSTSNVPTNTAGAANDSTASSSGMTSGIVEEETLPHVLYSHRPKATMYILSAKLMEKMPNTEGHTHLQQSHKYGFTFRACDVMDWMDFYSLKVGNDCHTPSFLPDNNKHKYPPDSRNYHCLVPTLELAKEWVQHLAWAAKMPKKPDIHSHAQKNYIPRQNNKHLYQEISPPMEEEQKHEIPALPENNTNKKPAASQGIIVVTKVISFQFFPNTDIKRKNEVLSSLPPYLKWPVNFIMCPSENFTFNFEIRLLLLPSTLFTSSNNYSNKNQLITLEEQTIFHSLPQLAQLLQSLRIECTENDNERRELLMNCALQVSKLIVQQKKCLDENQLQSSVIKPLDRIIRLLSTQAKICNSSHMRNFLHLHPKDAQTNVDDGAKITKRKIQSNIGVNGEVKNFLSMVPLFRDGMQKVKLKLLLVYLRYTNQIRVSTFLMFVAIDTSQFRWNIRLDVLCILFGVIFTIGFHFGTIYDSTQPEKEDNPLSKKTISSKRHTSSSPSISSTKSKMGEKVEDEREDEILYEKDKAEPANDIKSSDEDEDLDLDDLEEGDSIPMDVISSPLPLYPANGGKSCWSCPDPSMFKIRGPTYLEDRIKIPSLSPVFPSLGVDVWLNDEPQRKIAQFDCIMGGLLKKTIKEQTGREGVLVINFLLPFGNLVTCFKIPEDKADWSLWQTFLNAPDEERNERLKMLTMVVEGPWMVQKVVGPGYAPAVLGRVMPLEYYFDIENNVYEIDIDISSSRIARSILNVVKGHIRVVSLAFAFIIEAVNEEELPECVLCSFQEHHLHLDKCPHFPSSPTSLADESLENVNEMT